MKSPSAAIRSRWRDFSKVWNKVRRSPSSSAVHDLRSSGRKLAASITVVVQSTGISKAKADRRLERILSHIGPLRDLHIYRRTLLRFDVGNDMEHFSDFLDRQQSREKRRVEHHLKPRLMRDLRRRLDKVEQRFQKASDKWTYAEFRASFGGVLQQQFQTLIENHRTWAESPDDKRFHSMRVELRRLRYATEFAAEVLGTLEYADIQSHLRVMRDLQKIMGDIHDLHNMRTTLVAWSSRQSAKHRPALMNFATQLQHKYESRMVEFNDHCRAFEGCLPPIRIPARGRNSRRKRSSISI